ncbi:CAP domain-containing protein [Alteribacillus bidgolensis]|uniref:Uncharacterized protein, YkwD family n=1 Tax=Alteribacillus bidgolensis TaxID=930129 RepID=A0A1G8L078_9BACI|nr:CAP domain-containing protein [Alteribacillus bidgolensis]SDI49033.1 uncharacterized protein, YkwD family [Alteribacillus bidgolensis]
MRKKVCMLLSCILITTIFTGCNTDNQGAGGQRNNEYEQIGFTPGDGTENAERQQNNNRFPFNLFPGGEEDGDGGETPMLPVPNPDLEIEDPEVEVPDAEEFNVPEESEQEQADQSAEQPDESQEKEDPSDKGDAASGVIELTNQEREKNGLSALKADSEVAEVAQAKSEDMAKNNYFAHNSPTYGSPFNMLNDFGVDYTAAAENIAAGQGSAEEVVQAWMNSEGHRKNILNKEVTHIGVGYVEEGNHWTQMFIGK